MAKCIKTGEELPERTVYNSGHECRVKDRYTCKHFSHQFVDGTNCWLLRRPVNVRAILGIEGKQS